MSRIGLHSGPLIQDIFPNRPKDIITSWAVTITSLSDEDFIQIGGKYIFEIGSHSLISGKYQATFLDVLDIANLISYIFDTICYISYPKDKKESKIFYKGLKSYLNLIGKYRKYTNVEEIITNIYDVSTEVTCDNYMRKLPFVLKINRCWSCNLPNNKKLKMAFSVYRQALLSIEPQAMILNYWRVLEATTTKEKRYDLINSFLSKKIRPVKCVNPPQFNQFNLMTKYRKIIKKYFEDLLMIHKSPNAILDYLYKQRRNPSAHADINILEVNIDISLVSLYKDALLLKYLSRCAIEEFWSNLID